MSKRLQVVMDDEEYDEIQEAAEARRLTLSGWVRQTLRAARAGGEPSAVPAPPALSRPVEHALGGSATDQALLRSVMERHGFDTPEAAIRYALQRAATAQVRRDEIMELRGTGWAGDLDRIR